MIAHTGLDIIKTMIEQKILNIVNLDGQIIATKTLPQLLQQFEYNPILLKEVLEYHSNKIRVNTAHVKTKLESVYSKRKLTRQKGTGRARAGNRRQSQHVGGVQLFGPNGRIYSYSIPKKKISKALSICLTNRFQNNNLTVVDKLSLPLINTAQFINLANKLQLTNCLFIDTVFDKNITLSMRNVPLMNIVNVNHINSLLITRYKQIMITVDALEQLETRIYG